MPLAESRPPGEALASAAVPSLSRRHRIGPAEGLRSWFRGLAGLLIGLGCAAALARGPLPPGGSRSVEAMRAEEIATCRPGEAGTWPDGRDRPAPGGAVRLAYRHAGAPPWFSAGQVLRMVELAAVAWAACGVPTEVRALGEHEPLAEGRVLVHWPATASSGHFGLAHLGQRTLTLGRAAFELLRERNPAHPAEQVLQMVIAHEMGHFFGLMAHSSRCVDVMSYYTDAQGRACSTRDGGSHRRLPEYRSVLPTACDIQRCRAANGLPPLAR